jgi:hypothetical protein
MEEGKNGLPGPLQFSRRPKTVGHLPPLAVDRLLPTAAVVESFRLQLSLA